MFNIIKTEVSDSRFLQIGGEISAQAKVFLKNYSEPEKKFILFAYGRSGTELLRNLINSHPDIYCDIELFMRRKALFPKRYVENRSKIFGKKIYGFKAKVFQLNAQYEDEKRVKAEFFSDDFQIVYLRRENFFKQALSELVGQQRQKWHDREASPLKKKFTIDCDKLIQKMKLIEKYEKKEQEILEGVDYLKITYEDDLLHQGNHQQTLDRIFEYLGVELVEVSAKLMKTTPKKISDFIENHEEVTDAVKRTKYVVFLDE